MAGVRRAFLMATCQQYLVLVNNFATTMILSRLLMPSEIGIAVIGLAITTALFSLREFATPEFLIQLDDVSRGDIQTAFTALAGFGLLIAGALVALAPAIAGFYGHHSLGLFLMLTATALFIETIGMPAVSLLRRDMAFGTLAAINTAGAFTNSATTIALAATGHGFMSYAFGVVLGDTLITLWAFAACPKARGLRPSLAAWRKLADFGRYKGATSFIDRLYDALPQTVLGRLMPSAAVGIFNRSVALCGVPDRIVLGAVFSVAFPALAQQIRAGRDITASYLSALRLITGVYWPGMLLLALLAKPAVMLVLGPNWMAAVPIVRILALAALFWFPVTFAYPVLIAVGANRDAFVSNLIGRGVGAMVLCGASVFGVRGMALAQFIGEPFQMIVSLLYIRRHIPFSWRELVVSLLPSAAVSVAALAGPVVTIAALGHGLDVSIGAMFLMLPIAAVGWLAGIVIMRHPLLEEVMIALSSSLGRLPFPAARSLASAVATHLNGNR